MVLTQVSRGNIITFEHIIATLIRSALIMDRRPKDRKAESAKAIFPNPRLIIILIRFPS